MVPKPWRVKTKYTDLPTRGQALKALVKPHLKSAERHPTIFAILSRAMVVNARKLLQETEIGSDILLNISTLRGMSFLDLARGRELFNAANDQISNAINAVELAEGAGKLDHLRAAAQSINTSSDRG